MRFKKQKSATGLISCQPTCTWFSVAHSHRDLDGVPVVLVGTKSDTRDASDLAQFLSQHVARVQNSRVLRSLWVTSAKLKTFQRFDNAGHIGALKWQPLARLGREVYQLAEESVAGRLFPKSYAHALETLVRSEDRTFVRVQDVKLLGLSAENQAVALQVLHNSGRLLLSSSEYCCLRPAEFCRYIQVTKRWPF